MFPGFLGRIELRIVRFIGTKVADLFSPTLIELSPPSQWTTRLPIAASDLPIASTKLFIQNMNPQVRSGSPEASHKVRKTQIYFRGHTATVPGQLSASGRIGEFFINSGHPLATALQCERLQLGTAGVKDGHQRPCQAVYAVDGEAHQHGGVHGLFGVDGQ